MISDVEGILLFCAVLPRLLVRDLARFSELRCRAPRDPDDAQRPPPPPRAPPRAARPTLNRELLLILSGESTQTWAQIVKCRPSRRILRIFKPAVSVSLPRPTLAPICIKFYYTHVDFAIVLTSRARHLSKTSLVLNI